MSDETVIPGCAATRSLRSVLRSCTSLVAIAMTCQFFMGATVVEGQTLSSQSQRVDSLVAVWRATEARLQRFDDSVKVVRLANDTVLEPPLRILVRPGLRDLAAAAARAAVDSVTQVARSATSRLGERFLVVSALDPSHDRHAVLVRVLEPSGRETFAASSAAEVDELADALSTLALRVISSTIDPGFRAWIGEEVRWDSMSTAAWVYPRMNLVSMNTAPARACYDGDIQACSTLLMGGRLERPYPGGPRGSLVRVAMQMGGEGAFERFALARGTPAERLTTIAQAPMDSILRAWHSRVRYARVPSSDMNFSIAAMSAFWIVVCGALSLRSSRWR